MEELEKKDQSGDPSSNKKYLWVGLALLLAIGIAFYLKPPDKGKTEGKPPAFQRDEPAQSQIMQGDFKEKIQELLDSGKTVGEISRETGVRKDVIRKIKKESATTKKTTP